MACKVCAAKDQEIERLNARIDSLEERLIGSGAASRSGLSVLEQARATAEQDDGRGEEPDPDEELYPGVTAASYTERLHDLYYGMMPRLSSARPRKQVDE